MSVVLAETDGGVCTVTLADVANRNALSNRLVAELTDALDEAEADDSVRVIVLTNKGRVFCAGADLSERSRRASLARSDEAAANDSLSTNNIAVDDSLSKNISVGDSLSKNIAVDDSPRKDVAVGDSPSKNVTVGDSLSKNVTVDGSEEATGARVGRSASSAGELFARFGRSAKPYVGRIAGHCVAGGMGLAAAMDISVALDTAKMGFTEVRIGVAPAMISVLCLPKMRACDARSAFLRGSRFSGTEAARMGLIDMAVPFGELDSAVDEVVRDLLAGSPAGLAACKQLLAKVPKMTSEDAFAWTSELSARLFAGEDAKEGMSAYLQKRQPNWVPGDDRTT